MKVKIWRINNEEKYKKWAHIHSCLIWFIHRVVFTETDFCVRHKQYCEEKKLSSEKKTLRANTQKMNGFHREDLFFLRSNMKCHLFQCGYFFFLFYTHLWWCVALVWQLKKTNRRRKFFLICVCERICGKMGNDFLLYNNKMLFRECMCEEHGWLFILSHIVILFVVTYGDWQIFMFAKLKSLWFSVGHCAKGKTKRRI